MPIFVHSPDPITGVTPLGGRCPSGALVVADFISLTSPETGKARSFHRSSIPTQTHCVGLCVGAAFGGCGVQNLFLLRFNKCAWVCRTNTTWSVDGGPVWDRPLRRSRDRFLKFRRGGSQTRPCFQVSAHVFETP